MKRLCALLFVVCVVLASSYAFEMDEVVECAPPMDTWEHGSKAVRL